MNTDISYMDAKGILSKATGYISDFDYTLNPYRGCSFGCFYCYAAFFSGTAEKMERWGDWVEVKQNALALMTKFGPRLAGKKIYMSSVTDPYQPVELRTMLTRSLLEAMLPYQPRLVVQTRSPFVTRDIDLLRQFTALRVNMSITTDDDTIRRAFEPACASIDRRFAAIEEAKAAGIRTGICVTPMLPLRDTDTFATRLVAADADVYVSQAFQSGGSRFAASTRKKGLATAEEYGWDKQTYAAAREKLRGHLPNLYEGREGFMPE